MELTDTMEKTLKTFQKSFFDTLMFNSFFSSFSIFTDNGAADNSTRGIELYFKDTTLGLAITRLQCNWLFSFTMGKKLNQL